MSDCLCPLKEAARDAPNQLALLSHTYAELDALADSIAAGPICEAPSPKTIAQFFASWRSGKPIFLPNLRFPRSQIEAAIQQLKNAPPHIYLFTSGSTGTPKIAALSKANLLASAAASVDLRPNDQWKLTLPLYHVGGIGILLRCILARATIVLEDSPDITHLSYVPTQLYRATPVYKKLRCLLLGGAPITSFPDRLPIFATYGLTEMGSLVVVKQNPTTPYLGHPLKGREVKVAQDGEIWVRGACLFQGYWEEGKLRLPLDEQGWFATGDLGRYCSKEGLAIVGRKDWQFISGGENIQPEEIEKELLSLREVEEAVVVPIADAEFGARPIAVVKVNDPSFDLKRMRDALQDRLPKYKIPISLLILDEIPKIGFKINRKEIFKMISFCPNF